MNESKSSWLAERPKRLYATDMVDILGLGYEGWRTVEEIYREKLGEPPAYREPSLLMEFGTFAEPFIASLFTRATAIEVERQEWRVSVNKDEPWIGASLDYIARDFSAGVECKLLRGYPDENWGRDGTGWVPQRVAVQCSWQMLATGMQQTYVAAFFGMSHFRWYLIRRDDELIGMLKEIGASFWLRVLERSGVADWQCPLMEQALAKAQRIEPGKLLPTVLSDVDLKRANDLDKWRFMEKEAERQKESLKQLLTESMCGHEYAKLPDGSRLRHSPLNGALTRSARPKAVGGPKYELPDMSEAESLQDWLDQGGKEIDAAIAAIGTEQ